MKHTSLSIVAALCLAVPSMAFAGHGKACPLKDKKDCKKHYNIEAMDANKDGKVSFDEFKAAKKGYLKKKFERMDANGDGFISKDDKKVAHQKRMNEYFDKADANNDGVLSKEEFAAAKKHHKRKGHHGKH